MQLETSRADAKTATQDPAHRVPEKEVVCCLLKILGKFRQLCGISGVSSESVSILKEKQMPPGSVGYLDKSPDVCYS